MIDNLQSHEGAILYVSFEQWTGRRALATFGTNAGSRAIPFQRWRHFKEAFAPEIVYEAIRSSGIPVNTCLDPFGGSGTTALACQFLGVKPTTIEINPYLADLIEAKLTVYDGDRLVADLGAVLRNADHAEVDLQRQGLPATFVEPGLNGRWLFDQGVATRILSIVRAIEGVSTPSHRRLFRVLLGGVLVDLSNVIVNGKGRRYRRGWDRKRRVAGDVDVAFADAVSSAIAEIVRFEKRTNSEYNIIRGDSRKVIDSLFDHDIAIFSPPYPNSFDYTDVYNIELWMLGYLSSSVDNRLLRESTLASHVQIHRNYLPAPKNSQLLVEALALLDGKRENLWNKHIPDMLGSYFAEMNGILLALQSKLRAGGTIWSVVGDSRYAGVAINVADILAELATSLGLVVERNERLREMRASAQQGGKAQLAESLLVLRQP